jgi:hypothetical protein
MSETLIATEEPQTATEEPQTEPPETDPRCTAEVAECTCPEFCERDHANE